jgi:glycosyltransferase involved in cell wall biosynthesis
MTIAINANQHPHSVSNDFYLNDLMKIVAEQTDHQFILISSNTFGELDNIPDNIVPVLSAPLLNKGWMWEYWFNKTLPSIVNKHQASLLINTGAVCSKGTTIPQWVFVNDLSYFHFPLHFSKKQLEFLNNKVPEFLEIANGIVTSDDFIAKDIKKRFSIKDDKIKLFSIATSAAYQPIYWGDKESVKNSYADGKEYFLFSGDISPRYDLINLLKAFSIFKAKQQSNMQLLITAKSISINDPFNKIFNTYKYRREVQILTGLSEKKLAKITAAAYGFIYPAHSAESALLPLQAMQCDVPVISSPLETLKEKLGDAALYADPSNFEDIAEKMILLFIDETERSDMIESGKLIVNKFKDEKTNTKWWKSVLAQIKKGKK